MKNGLCKVLTQSNVTKLRLHCTMYNLGLVQLTRVYWNTIWNTFKSLLEIVGYKVVRKKAQIDINKIRQKKLLIKLLKKIRQNKMLKKTVKNTSLEKTLRKNVTQKFLTNKFMGSLITSFSIFPHMLYCQ